MAPAQFYTKLELVGFPNPCGNLPTVPTLNVGQPEGIVARMVDPFDLIDMNGGSIINFMFKAMVFFLKYGSTSTQEKRGPISMSGCLYTAPSFMSPVSGISGMLGAMYGQHHVHVEGR